MKKKLTINVIGIIVLISIFFTWQYYTQTSNVPIQPHVDQNKETNVYKYGNNDSAKKIVSKEYLERYNDDFCLNKEKFSYDDFKSFYLVDDISVPNEYGESSAPYYIQNKKYVYFGCKKIENSDPSTFKILSLFFAKDKNNVYISNMWDYTTYKINIVDANSFEVLNKNFVKDKNNVYYFVDGGINIVKNAKPKNFHLLNEIYAKDDSSIYCYTDSLKDKRIKEADLSTFKVLEIPNDKNSRYSKDKNNVYYYEKVLKEADSSTFSIISTQYTKDINNCYSYGNIVNKEECE